MANLFALADEYQALYDKLMTSMDEDGVVDIDIAKEVGAAKGSFEEKAVATATVYRKLENTSNEVAAEIKRLQGIKKHVDAQKDRVKDYLSTACQNAAILNISGVTARISFRKSEETEVPDVNLLDDEYKRIKITYEADKVKIKNAIKAGITVNGARLVEKNNIQIK